MSWRIYDIRWQALTILSEVLPLIDADPRGRLRVLLRTWVAKFDIDDGNRKLAEGWENEPYSSSCYSFLNASYFCLFLVLPFVCFFLILSFVCPNLLHPATLKKCLRRTATPLIEIHKICNTRKISWILRCVFNNMIYINVVCYSVTYLEQFSTLARIELALIL